MKPEDFKDKPDEIIKGCKIFMISHIVRTVICPDSSVVALQPKEMKAAYNDLSTWSLPIRQSVMDQ